MKFVHATSPYSPEDSDMITWVRYSRQLYTTHPEVTTCTHEAYTYLLHHSSEHYILPLPSCKSCTSPGLRPGDWGWGARSPRTACSLYTDSALTAVRLRGPRSAIRQRGSFFMYVRIRLVCKREIGKDWSKCW